MEDVNESKLKPHNTLSHSVSIHLIANIDTNVSFSDISLNITTAIKVIVNIKDEVINCDPFTPTFLPRKPETIEPNKGSTIKAKYIIYNLWLWFLLICKTLLKFLDQ